MTANEIKMQVQKLAEQKIMLDCGEDLTVREKQMKADLFKQILELKKEYYKMTGILLNT